jgi:hypothetical protein
MLKLPLGVGKPWNFGIQLLRVLCRLLDQHYGHPSNPAVQSLRSLRESGSFDAFSAATYQMHR